MPTQLLKDNVYKYST